jgi:hypothetical protein
MERIEGRNGHRVTVSGDNSGEDRFHLAKGLQPSRLRTRSSPSAPQTARYILSWNLSLFCVLLHLEDSHSNSELRQDTV